MTVYYVTDDSALPNFPYTYSHAQDDAATTGESTVHNLRSRGSSALRSILSILVGRGDLGGLGSADTDSEESAEGDENDPSFWPPLRRPQPPRPVKPDKELVQAG